MLFCFINFLGNTRSHSNLTWTEVVFPVMDVPILHGQSVATLSLGRTSGSQEIHLRCLVQQLRQQCSSIDQLIN